MVAVNPAAAAKFLAAPSKAVHGFLLYGSDSSQIAARAQALAGALIDRLGPEAEIIRLHDSDLTSGADRISVELATGSLFGGTKIVWLTSFPAKAHAPLAAMVARPIEDAYLVVQAPDLKKNHKLVQTFEAASYLAAVPSYGETEESLSAAIRQHVQSAGYEIAPDAAALVGARCDLSALLAQREAEKLMTFAAPSRRITL